MSILFIKADDRKLVLIETSLINGLLDKMDIRSHSRGWKTAVRNLTFVYLFAGSGKINKTSLGHK